MIGASLAVSGVVLQGLFRNPLADPGLVGVSAGASLGAVGGHRLAARRWRPLFALGGIYTLPLAAFLGGLATTFLLYRIATRGGQTSVATLLLAGIALAALTGAVTGILVSMADDKQLRDLTFWGLGSLSGATWTKVVAIAPIILVSLTVIPVLARGLNAITLGEAAAPLPHSSRRAAEAHRHHRGRGRHGGLRRRQRRHRLRRPSSPHLLRLVIGPDHRTLLPASALLGGTLLMFADMIARTIVAPAELPIGIITALVGGPFFLWLLLKGRTQLGL